MRGGGSAVRFHDCTNNSAMTNMRDIKDMVSYWVSFFRNFLNILWLSVFSYTHVLFIRYMDNKVVMIIVIMIGPIIVSITA